MIFLIFFLNKAETLLIRVRKKKLINMNKLRIRIFQFWRQVISFYTDSILMKKERRGLQTDLIQHILLYTTQKTDLFDFKLFFLN